MPSKTPLVSNESICSNSAISKKPSLESRRPLDESQDANEIPNDEVVPFADELKLDSFFAGKGNRCLYLYDFGDGWQHLVRLIDVVESNEPFTRRLVDGAMACPPEDCGGPLGYEELLGYLAMTEEQVSKLDEAEQPEVEWIREKYCGWKPNAFDLAANRPEFAIPPESDSRNP